MNEDRLMALPFDFNRLQATGDPVPVLDGIQATATASLSFSHDGTVAYVPRAASSRSQLVWVNHQGEIQASRQGPGTTTSPEVLA